MKLYEICVGHYGPKDGHHSIQGYLIAETDEEVYEFIKSEPTVNGEALYNSWADLEEEGEIFEYTDHDNTLIIEETFKERMIRIKGEENDEEYDFDDAYYGITLFGWAEVKEITPEIEETLLALGIAVKYKK